ncbi:MAG: TRAP transporter substrate-binding protein DctP [Candidatus Latescibacterota bacterium]|nr:MAG: TRAP transporter substrate-binding protein DctP [Candidatus Latescibacterota bacterium]
MRRQRESRATILGFACLASALALPAAPLHAAKRPKPKVELKIATVAPEGTTWMKVMRQIDNEVREATGNFVGFKVYPNSSQGDEGVVLRKIRAGQLHGGGLTGRGLGMIARETRVVELPFLFDNYEQIDAAYERVGERLAQLLHDGGYTLLGWAEVGFVYLFSKQPIATQSDLSSAKMWLWEGDPLAEAFYRQAQVAPVPLAVTDVMTSLQTRLIDAVYSSPYACLGLQWFTRVQYFTDVPITFASGAVVVSNKAFARIPEEHRETVLRICRQRFRELVEKTRVQNTESLDEIVANGVERVEVSDADLQRFRDIGRRVWEDQTGALYTQELLDLVLGAAENPGGGNTVGGGSR